MDCLLGTASAKRALYLQCSGNKRGDLRTALERRHAVPTGLEAELAVFERQTMRAVTVEQKRQIFQLASDLPRLWAASTTAPRDRKRMLRLLGRDITVTKWVGTKVIRLNVCWQGGATETLELKLPPNRAEAVRYPFGSDAVPRLCPPARERHVH
jgi:hypothetical protein